MQNNIVHAVEGAIDNLVSDFQTNTTRYLRGYNERDLHWILFYYLKQQSVVPEKYLTELIRAEFPTRKIYKDEMKTPARGHYDLVILDPISYNQTDVQNIKTWDPWQPFLDRVDIEVAIEIKLWLARLDYEKIARWDICKLTECNNGVHNAYFLNFVQLNFARKIMVDWYKELQQYLKCQRSKYPKLKILCVPNDMTVQPDASNNWI